MTSIDRDQDRQVLVRIPSGIPIDLVAALGTLISEALPGTMLGQGNRSGTAAEVLLGDRTPREAAELLRRAADVLAGTEHQPAAERGDVDDLELNRLEIDEDTGVTSVSLGGAKETADRAAKNLLGVFLPYMEEQGATNYLQWELMLPQRNAEGRWDGPDKRFAVIVVRPDGKTPHELKVEAEAELARVRAGEGVDER